MVRLLAANQVPSAGYGEHIARIGRIGLQFVPQTVDVDSSNGPGVGFGGLIAPYLLDKRHRVEGSIRPGHQRDQNIIFGRC